MRILLISTYELGRQPVHLASPAALLRRQGHETRTVDLSVEEFHDADVDWAERVAISVPMHTATRLADQVVAAISARRPTLPIALFGLYASVGDADVEARLSGEYEPGLLLWAEGALAGPSTHLGRSDFEVPERKGLPGLDSYARLERDGTAVLAGAVEASHGCRHRCRHCPIPAIYDGRLRVVPADVVVNDIAGVVDAGARHITFVDADFLNAPAHSLAIMERAHSDHPEVTFDATVKVEHILEHRDLWPRLAELNLLFVVSAFESVDETTLAILDKGHTVADMREANEVVRSEGIALRPTWLPFLPWTRPDDIAETFSFIADNDLVGATDPVQMSIRLLVPRGSLLEDHPALTPHLVGYDSAGLTWRWEFADPESEILCKELEMIAANASDCDQESVTTLNEMRDVVVRRTGRQLPTLVAAATAPRLSESWFCCSEPTEGQAISIQISPR